MGKVYRLKQERFFPLNRQGTCSRFYWQVINWYCAKKCLVAICLAWNVAHWHSMTKEVWNLLKETLIKGKPDGFVFFWGRLPEKGGSIFHGGRSCDLHRNYGMVIILLSLLLNCDHLILKLHQKKRQLSWWRMAFYWQIQSWKCARTECCSCSI